MRIDKRDWLLFQQMLSNHQFWRNKTWKSVYQSAVSYWVWKRQHDIIAIMPTGHGKTLCYALPSLIEVAMFTIVIVPLRSLQHDLQVRLQRMGLRVVNWSPSLSPDISCNVVLSTVESLVDANWRSFIAANGPTRVARIVIEECHLMYDWSSWRIAMNGLRLSRSTAVPLLLLSATVPVNDEVNFQKAFQTPMAVFRAPIQRPDLEFSVEKVQDDSDQTRGWPRLAAKLYERVSSHVPRFQAADRAIIYVLWSYQISAICSKLDQYGINARGYHGEMSDEERDLSHEDWSSGKAIVMVATTAFGLGIDYPAVRLVIHFGFCYSVSDLYQGAGRASRDGRGASHVLLISDRSMADAQKFLVGKGSGWCFDEVKLYIDESDCRVAHLSSIYNTESSFCFQMPNQKHCDLCSRSALGSVLVPPTQSPKKRKIHHTELVFSSSTSDRSSREDARSSQIAWGEGSIAVHQTQREKVAHQSRTQLQSMKEQIVSFNDSVQDLLDKCPLCWIHVGLQSHPPNHHFDQCPRKGKSPCFICWEQAHPVGRCPFSMEFSETGFCYQCYLPSTVNGIQLHGMGSKVCVFKRSLIALCIQIFKHHHIRQLLCRHLQSELNVQIASDGDLKHFLPKRFGQMTGVMWIVIWLMNWMDEERSSYALRMIGKL